MFSKKNNLDIIEKLYLKEVVTLMRIGFIGLGAMGAATTLILICPEPGVHSN